MNILFLDETLQLKQSYVGIGGVIFHDDCLATLFNLFKHEKTIHSIPSQEEIKWSPPKNSWIGKNLKGNERISTYSGILALVKPLGGRVIVAVVKVDRSKRGSLTAAKWKCLEFVTERFQFYLQTREDREGIIIADYSGSRQEDKRLLQDYYLVLDKGTKYIKPSNIVMNLLTTESHLNPGLQIADLVVGVTTGMCTPKKSYALPYWETVKRSLHRNQNGEVMGCGLKVWPNELVPEIREALFPEESTASGESHEEYIERMRYLYSVLFDEEELDMYFPRP